jgi:hypothetical protein
MEREDFGCSKVTNWKIERLKKLKFVALQVALLGIGWDLNS